MNSVSDSEVVFQQTLDLVRQVGLILAGNDLNIVANALSILMQQALLQCDDPFDMLDSAVTKIRESMRQDLFQESSKDLSS